MPNIGGSVQRVLENLMKVRKEIKITDIARKKNSMTDKEKPIEEMTQEEARAAGRWLEWWGAVQKELASKQREHNMFVNNRPIRS